MGMNESAGGLGLSPEEKRTRQEAVAGILLAMAYADGLVQPSEIRLLVDSLDRMKLFYGVEPERIEWMTEGIFERVKSIGTIPYVKETIPACPKDLHQTVFALAVDMMLVDGVVHEKEKELLAQLQPLLGVPNDLTAKIVEVMTVKNRG